MANQKGPPLLPLSNDPVQNPNAHCSTKQLIEAAVTVGLVVLLLERALVQLLQAEGAHEMLRMEFLEHGRNAASGDGFRAAGAQRAALGVVMRLAVRQTVVVEERAALERLTAILKRRSRYTD